MCAFCFHHFISGPNLAQLESVFIAIISRSWQMTNLPVSRRQINQPLCSAKCVIVVVDRRLHMEPARVPSHTFPQGHISDPPADDLCCLAQGHCKTYGHLALVVELPTLQSGGVLNVSVWKHARLYLQVVGFSLVFFFFKQSVCIIWLYFAFMRHCGSYKTDVAASVA